MDVLQCSSTVLHKKTIPTDEETNQPSSRLPISTAWRHLELYPAARDVLQQRCTPTQQILASASPLFDVASPPPAQTPTPTSGEEQDDYENLSEAVVVTVQNYPCVWNTKLRSDTLVNREAESNIVIPNEQNFQDDETQVVMMFNSPSVKKRKSEEASKLSILDTALVQTLQRVNRPKEAKDADELSCLGLVDSLKALPKQKNVLAKIKIQQVLYEL
eukprot:gene16423-7831_t